MPKQTLPDSEPARTAMQDARRYLAALRRLGLTPASQRTARLLGLSVTQCQKIKSGRSGVTAQLDLLLSMYLKHGLPKD